MTWRTYFKQSKNAVELEELLKPNLKEHNGDMKGTINSNVEKMTINLDVSQSPLKTALSYAYELKNIEKARKYAQLNDNAKKRSINKAQYIKQVINLEAEAIFFRCQVFRDFGAQDDERTFKKDYLDIYDSTDDAPIEERINQIALYIQEKGIIRRQYSATKYYADCYDFYAGKKQWPSFYDEKPKQNTIILKERPPWRTYLERSKNAVNLERLLKPHLIELDGGMKSTANTDVDKKIINLDVSQSPLKTALSYAYELKNLENAGKYAEINDNAKKRSISKAQYIKQVIKLEAEAIFFRCQVFRDLGTKDAELPFKKDYLDIYDSTEDDPIEDRINQIALYIQEKGIVRRQYSTTKYYADCYDFYAGKKQWPSFYDEKPKQEVIVLEPQKLNNPPKI